MKNSSKKAKVKWWVIAIVAPLVVGVGVSTFKTIIHQKVTPKVGELHVVCEKDSALVVLNGTTKGITSSKHPLILKNITKGSYVLQIKMDDEVLFQRTIVIKSDEFNTINTILKSTIVPSSDKPKKNKVRDSDNNIRPNSLAQFDTILIVVYEKLANAKIFVNDKWVANAPSQLTLKHGSHTIKVEKDDYYFITKIADSSNTPIINILDSEVMSKN